MSKPITIEWTPEERLELERLARTIEAFEEISQTFPVSFMRTFLTVALKQGHGPVEYGKRMGVITPVVSRALAKIGMRGRRKGETSYELIEPFRDDEDARAIHYHLTPKGRSLLKKVLKAQGV